MERLILEALTMLLEANASGDRMLQRLAAFNLDLMVYVATVTKKA